MSNLDFYFDFACPWCYVGSYGIRELAKEGVQINYHVWKMPETVTAPPKPEGYYDAARARLKELRQQMGIKTIPPVQDNTIPALKAVKIADSLGKAEAFVEHVFHAHWAEQKNIADPDVLVSVAEQIGLNGSEFRAALEANAGDAAFEQDLKKAAELEVNTIPSYINGDRRLLVHHFEDMPTVEQLRSLFK